jgi:hypothetical protein
MSEANPRNAGNQKAKGKFQTVATGGKSLFRRLRRFYLKKDKVPTFCHLPFDFV